MMIKRITQLICIFSICCGMLLHMDNKVLADTTNVEDGLVVATEENVGSSYSYDKYNTNAIPDIGNVNEIVDYLQLGSKHFSHQAATLNVEDIVSHTMNMRRIGEVSDTFRSADFETGTPGVTWYYIVDYTIAPMSNGIGWYFVDADVTCGYKKNGGLWTYANTCNIEWAEAAYTLSPRSKPTSITVNVEMEFTLTTDATGATPIKYSESHEHTTYVDNMYQD